MTQQSIESLADLTQSPRAESDWRTRASAIMKRLNAQIPTTFQQLANILLPQSPTAQAISANGTTITLSSGVVRLAPNAAYTGIIVPVGTFGGQPLILINESVAANTLTMAAAGTSHVADGVGCVLAGVRLMWLTWNSSTALWYH